MLSVNPTPHRGSPSSSNISLNGTNGLFAQNVPHASTDISHTHIDNGSIALPNPTIAITPPPTTNPPNTTTHPTHSDARGGTLPTAICAYYLNSIKGLGQGCLRVNCKFFHGTEQQLADLRKRHKRLKSPNGSNASTRSGSTVVSREGEAKDVAPPQRLKLVKDNELGNKRPIVCLNYLTDTCHRPGCRFLHLPANVRPLPMTVCDYYSTGTCTRKRCRFFHGTQEVLSRMHAQGVTMYNPITNEPHDPATSLEELMRLQERTTVPINAATTLPPSAQPVPQPVQTVYVHHGQLPPQSQPYTIQYLTPATEFAPPTQRHADPMGTYLPQMQVPMMNYQQTPMHTYPSGTPGLTTIVIRQSGPSHSHPASLNNTLPHMQGLQHSQSTIPDSVLQAILQQHPGATVIAAPAQMPYMPSYHLQTVPQNPPLSISTSLQPSTPNKSPLWGVFE